MTIYNPEREELHDKIIVQMSNENCDGNIFDEFNEQYIFMSKNKLQSMVSWNLDQFIAWYENI